MPKAMLVFAHPDDETVALGGRLERFGRACLVHVTDGAPRNEQDSRAHGFKALADYREARKREIIRALIAAGASEMRYERLEIPDQEASLNLLLVTRDLVKLITRERPEVVFTHPYEGGHPDHDACAFAVHHALPLIRNSKRPIIVEAGCFRDRGAASYEGDFLQACAPEIIYDLSSEEKIHKRDLIACFKTQRVTLSGFSVTRESFRIAPPYDFRQPPHDGPVHYDHYPWGMKSERFCELAKAAEIALEKGSEGMARE